jgi:hypothetical protein
VGRDGEIFGDPAEARARFNALAAAGTPVGFVIASSLDDCIAWIDNSPSDAEISQARIIRWALDDNPDDEEGPQDSDSGASEGEE